MKKLAAWSIVSVIMLSLVACAGMSGEAVKVKCPSCGYEFDVERYGK